VTPRWQPTATLVRAALGSSALALAAVVFGRPDLLVLAVPLFVHAVAAMTSRPGTTPAVRHWLLHRTLREGEGTTLRARITDAADVEHAVVALAPHDWWASKPASGVLGVAPTPGTDEVTLDVPVASLRWGVRAVGDGLAAATGPWAGYRWGPYALLPVILTTLPLPGRFDSRSPVPHPIGLVGTNPARRPGEGTEFASIRPFAPGDRLRRLHWRVSLRTGRLHVTSTVAEQDSSVLLLVDSGVEIGDSGGVGGTASSLDIGVRAAGAVAEHYLYRGERVGLRVLGSTARNAVHVSAGRRHLRRVLDTLARVSAGEHRGADPRRMRFHVPAGTVVVVFSPMLSDQAVVATTMLAQRGLSVIVVDTLPSGVDVAGGDGRFRLAWRMRLLERDALLARVQRAGIPVVAWRGPGTLDEVLIRLGRRASLPTLVRR
jgi:uncharacterized protein (DUF58 family)